MRRELWGEHLAMSPTDARLRDPVTAVREWTTQATAGTARMRLHTPGTAQRAWPRHDNVADPDGRC